MGGIGSGRKKAASDAEKLARGPLDKRFSEEAINERKVVQLFQHPRLDTIPDAEFPLGDKGKSKYRELAEMLLKAGQLTIVTKGYAETAAIAFETIHRLQEDGKEVKAALIQQYNRSLGNIQQFDIDKAPASAQGQRKNRFARAGFSSRRR